MQNTQEQFLELTNEPTASRKWWALLGIGLGSLMLSLDIFIVNLALPTLVRSLHTSFAHVQWVSLGYLLPLTVLVLFAARLGDMWNKKRLYLGGLILFTISSLLCGIAPTVGFLIGFRVIQGIGAVFMGALGLAIITEVFPKQERGLALGIINGLVWVGYAAGPAVGGLLIGLVSWRLIFWVNLPVGVITTVIVAKAVPACAGSEAKKGFDLAGGLLIAVTLTCFALGMNTVQKQGFDSPTALIILAIAVIGLGCFLVVEARSDEPMLDLKIFRSYELTISLLMRSMVVGILTGLIFIQPFFLELVKQYSAQQEGFLLVVAPIFSGVIAPVSGRLSDRFGSRIISLIGLVLMVFGCLAISTFDKRLTMLGYILRIAPWALGIGMFQSPNNSVIMGAVPQERLGIASGLLYLSYSLGQTTGLALMGTLFSLLTLASAKLPPNVDVTSAPVEALVSGVQMSFRLIAPIVMVGAILTAFLLWLEQSKELPSGEQPQESA